MKNVLFNYYQFGNNTLQNRIVMAPMTRSRASMPGEIPNDLMAKYYAQRAEAGLIITEATQVSKQGQGYARTPGIYTPEQIKGWQKVTTAVKEAGSAMVLQLWHVGRVSSSKVNNLQPLGPSAIVPKETSVYIFDGAPNGDATFVPCEEPKAMTQDDIDQTIVDFTQGAKNAVEAGFAAVEVHGANGYLIDQFLRSNANKRTDKYGGSKENRIQLLLEITQSIVDSIGADKVGVRLSPFITFKDMADPGILDTIMLAVEALEKMGILYIHLCEADWDDAPEIPESFRQELRSKFSGTIIAAGNYTPKKANEFIEKNYLDLVAFGRKFIPNPDYPTRIKNSFPLAEISDSHTLFGGGDARGYTDYPNYTS